MFPEAIIVGVALVAIAGFYLWFKRQMKLGVKAEQQKLSMAFDSDRVKLTKMVEDQTAALNAWKTKEEANFDTRIEKMATQKAQTSLQQWKLDEEVKIRADAIHRSAAVSKGKILEHLAAFMSTFKYHPADARFLGSPVDLIVFDGLSEGKLEAVRFLEIKTGKGRLTGREEEIRSAIEEKRVSWEQIKVD